MTRTRTAAVLIALLVAATGCSDDEEPDSTPTTPPTVATPEPAADTVELAAPGSGVGTFTSCVPAGSGGSWITWTELRVNRPASLDDVSLVGAEGSSLELADVAYTARPEGRQRFTAVLEGDEPPQRFQEQVGWGDRRPIDGSTLDPGRYYLFLVLDVSGPASFDGTEIAWTSRDGASGTTAWEQRQEFARAC